MNEETLALDKQFVFVYIQSQNVAAASYAAPDMPEESFETPQPTQPTEPKPTNWPKIVLFAVLGLGLLTAAVYTGYWYGTESAKLPPEADQTSKPPAVSQPTPKPTPTPIPTPTPTQPIADPTAGWKTYASTKYGFEMKYPREWILEPDKQVPDQIVSFVRSDSPDERCGLTVYLGTAHTGLPEGKMPLTVESVVIGGVTASKEIYEDPHGLGTMYEWIKFPAGTSVNQIPTYYKIGDDTCSETLDTILSTFKFL